MNEFFFEPALRRYWEGLCRPGQWHDHRRRVYDTELVYISRGAVMLELDGRVLRLERGMFALIPPGVWHESWVEAGGEGMRHCVHLDWNRAIVQRFAPIQAYTHQSFDKSLVHEVPAPIRALLPLIVSAADGAAVAPVMEEAVAALRKNARVGVYLLWPVLRHLLAVAEGAPRDAKALGKTARAVERLKDFIDAKYAEPVGYREFTRETGLSRAYLCHAFRTTLGETPTSYLNAVRLRHAERLLRTSALNVKEVAQAVGIPDANYFTRLFRREIGVAPSKV